MRKVILMIVLAFVSNSAIAKWVKFEDAGSSINYYDPTNISYENYKAKAWFLYDFKKQINESNGRSFISMNWQYEFDCVEKKSRTLSIVFYPKKMGEGVGSNGPINPSWSPDSGNMLNLACKNLSAAVQKLEAESANYTIMGHVGSLKRQDQSVIAL